MNDSKDRRFSKIMNLLDEYKKNKIKVHKTLSLTKDSVETLEKLSKKHGLNFSEIIQLIIDDYLKNL